MKKEARPEGIPGARDVRSGATTSTLKVIATDGRSAQSPNSAIDIKHVGAIWKSPRDKRTCIQAGFKSFNDSPPYLDLRVFEMDATGRMQPTRKGITISAQRVMQLAKLIGDAGRQAQQLGLVQVSS